MTRDQRRKLILRLLDKENWQGTEEVRIAIYRWKYKSGTIPFLTEILDGIFTRFAWWWADIPPLPQIENDLQDLRREGLVTRATRNLGVHQNTLGIDDALEWRVTNAGYIGRFNDDPAPPFKLAHQI
jgi:hypothetical protein